MIIPRTCDTCRYEPIETYTKLEDIRNPCYICVVSDTQEDMWESADIVVGDL